MRILHLSDLHYRRSWFEWLCDYCRDFDLLVLSGDLANMNLDVGMLAQTEMVSDWLLRLPIPTVICSGNHDYWTVRSPGPADPRSDGGWLKALKGRGNIIGVDGDILEFDGLRICVNGWGASPPEESFDIIVTHAPPDNSGELDLWESVGGCPPLLILCGHLHKPRRLAANWPAIDPLTVILIPGCDMGNTTPPFWIVDTITNIATHSSGATHVLRLGEENPVRL